MSAARTGRLAARLVAVGVVALLVTSCAADTSGNPTAPTVPVVARSELGQLLDDFIDGTPLPAVGVTTFTADRIIETDVAGVRRAGHPTPAQVTDQFSIGSNAKAMSTAMVATFIDAGAIGWDTTIADIYEETIPGIDPTWAALSVRQLLSHTAGLDDQTLFPALAELDPIDQVTQQRRDALAFIAATPLRRPPGEFAYSNIGYTVVAAMLEELTGTSWEDLIQSRVFDPLGMDSCGFYAPGTPGQVDQPWGHLDELGGEAMDPGDPDADLPPALAPAGMVHCSMADYVRFLQSQLRGFQGSTTEIISPESFQAIRAPAEGSDYALGWLVGPGSDGAATFYHRGSNQRFTAEVWLDPSNDWGLVTVTNIGETIADPLLTTIDQAMFNRRNTQ